MVSARLEPSSGDPIALTVFEDRVMGYIPPGTYGGNATLRLTSEDELLNSAVFTLAVTILAPTGPSPSAPAGRGPGITPTATPSRRAERHTARSRSRIRVASVSNVETVTRTTSPIRAHATSRARTQLATSSAIRARSSTRAHATIHVETPVRTYNAHHVRRREGPDEEALLLGLL